MRLFVTGATGFIGSEVVRQAVAAGHEVTALRRKTSKTVRLDGLPIRFAIGDVTDARSVSEGMRGADAVIHMAGDTSFYIGDRRRLEAINIGGVRNVLQATTEHGVRSIVSTSSVAAIGYDPTGGVATEETPFNWPGALPYMRTKRAGEDLMREAARRAPHRHPQSGDGARSRRDEPQRRADGQRCSRRQAECRSAGRDDRVLGR